MKNLQSYEKFLDDTRINTNNTLNHVLWYFLIVGIAVAFGINAGMFPEIKYESCFVITIIILVLAYSHRLLCKKKPKSKLTSFFALISLDVLLVYMVNSHLGIYLTYCLVPTLSLLYCDHKVFVAASVVNYIAMAIGTFMISPFFASYSTLYPDSLIWFVNNFAGYTIEAIVMYCAGSAVCKFATTHVRELYKKQHELEESSLQIRNQLDVLKSMSEVYQVLNLVDFELGTETSMNELDKDEKFSVDGEARVFCNREILETVLLEYRDSFAAFTDLSTLRKRMKGKKTITMEVQDSIAGWLRCQYISLGGIQDGNSDKFVYTIENVVEEKRREERLIRISNTDELTKLHNRRSFENDIKKYNIEMVEDDFVIFAIDINGLKQTNDNFGHDAGDELIQGAGICLLKVFGNIGKIYRVGGDEFIVLLNYTGNIPELKRRLKETAEKWNGEKVKNLDFSVGYACKCDYPVASFKELEKKADKMMYSDKEMYYCQRGVDRRGMQMAYGAICSSYIKILKIDLNSDSFKVIKVLDEESYGSMTKISEWFVNFEKSGNVHSGDVPEYRRLTNLEFLREHFRKEESAAVGEPVRFFYRRKYGDAYCRTLMEIVPIEGNVNPLELFLYVKNIDG